MAYCIGFILILWLMSKAKKKPKKEWPRVRIHKTISCGPSLIDELIYVTSDELDEVLVRMDELEERLKEMKR